MGDASGAFGQALILHSAILNPGNSGGSLLNAAYPVVGANVITTFPQNQGFGGAIPATSARSLASRLIARLQR